MQAEREREVAEVVGLELELPALRGQLEVRQCHHAGVVDEDVQRARSARYEGGDRGRVRQVEPDDVDRVVTRAGPNVGGRTLAGANVAHGQRHVGARPGQRPCRVDSDAR
jgi:hypothetical protein